MIDNGAPQETVHLSGQVMTEAPCSASVKIRSPNGFAWILSIRKSTGKEVLHRLQDAEAWLLAQGYKSAEIPERPGVPDAAGEPTCRYHGTEHMHPSKFGKGNFVCSKQLEDGSYCHANWPRKQ